MNHWHNRMRIILAWIILVGSLGYAAHPAAATSVIPTQYITRLYTEALGRAPDQPSWQNMESQFASGCTVAQLKALGKSFYTTGEYTNLNYGHAAKVLSLYRGALNREPDAGGFDLFHKQLERGTPWATVVNSIFDSSEFAGQVPYYCKSDDAGYLWRAGPPLTNPTMPVSVTGDFNGGTQAALQATLDAKSRAGGGIVTLGQRAVVTVDGQPLVVPGNVTLMTVNAPTYRRYAEMGRIIRTAKFNGYLVEVRPGGTLKNVWVDGRQTENGYIVPPEGLAYARGWNVHAMCDVTVTQNRVTDAAGGINIYVGGAGLAYLDPPIPEYSRCKHENPSTISENFITAYASEDRHSFQDGISVAYHNTTVEWNVLVEVTDVAIILFQGQKPDVSQHSKVRFNTIFSGGNAIAGGIGLDPGTVAKRYDVPSTFSFAGALVEDNVLWTSSRGYIKIALSVGTRPWFGQFANYGNGATVRRNRTTPSGAVVPGVETRSNIHIAAAGLNGQTSITENTLYGPTFLRPTTEDPYQCPVVSIARDANSAYSPALPIQGNSNLPTVTFPNTGCVGKPWLPPIQ
jgi:hypothetical protein